MPRLFFTVGLPGSGKSTLYKAYFSKAAYVSSDQIRQDVFGDVNDQTHNAEVFNLMLNRTRDLLKANVDVYYDATNINAKRRIGFLKELSKIPDLVKICVLCVPPFEVVKERNASRERVVPEFVLDRMLRGFEMPDYAEGWDKIMTFGNDNNFDVVGEMLFEADDISHDNHHHSLSIGGHMRAAEKYIVDKMIQTVRDSSHSDLLRTAALFHDIGKPYCKVYHDARNNPTEEAHFYNHENVGAYFYLSHSGCSDRNLYIALLINHHMDHYKGEKYMEKMAARYSAEFMRDLELLHEADKAAH